MKIMQIAAALAALFVLGTSHAAGQDGQWRALYAFAPQDSKNQAAGAVNSGDYSQAIKLLEAFINEHPFDDAARQMLSKAYAARGWEQYAREGFEEGFDDFRKANSYSRDKMADVYLGLGYGSFRMKEFDDALYYLYDAVYLNPDEPHGHEMIGSIYYQRGRLEEAIQEWELAVSLGSEDAGLKNVLAKAKKEFEVEGGFRKTETYYFNIKYEGEERRDLGDMVLDVLDSAYRDIGGDLDYYPREPVAVILYTKQQFSDITDAPSWSSGIFDGNIRIPVGGEFDKNSLSVVLYHEYAHAVVAMMAGRGIPTWLNEGVAQYEERWVRELDPRMDPGMIAPISSLNGSFMGLSDPMRASAAYRQSLSMVMFFVDRFGSYNLSKLVRLVGEGAGLADAMRQCTGITLDEFERYWREGLAG